MEMALFSGVHFFNRTFERAGDIRTRLPELHYERPAHNEFRIGLSFCLSVDISSGSRGIFVGAREEAIAQASTIGEYPVGDTSVDGGTVQK
jgi:hypothetical protein